MLRFDSLCDIYAYRHQANGGGQVGIHRWDGDDIIYRKVDGKRRGNDMKNGPNDTYDIAYDPKP